MEALKRAQPIDPPTTDGTLLDGPKLIFLQLGSRFLTPASLDDLPSDEAQLRHLVEAGNVALDATDRDRAVAEFQSIGDALRFEPFSPQVTAALYRILATVPGVERRGEALDALHRRGVVISIESGTTRYVLVIDPATGRLLERSTTKIASDEHDPQVPVGTVTSRETIQTTTAVSGVAVRPDGSLLDTSGWTICTPQTEGGHDTGTATCTRPS
jgi:hypothetical protein